MDMQTLFQAVDSLTLEERQRLYDYLSHQLFTPSIIDLNSPRILGLHANAGEFWISDDFDDVIFA